MLDAKLETLLIVAEEKSFTKAAAILSLTQPAVSNHISLLEKEIGIKIFLRTKGEVKITPEGEVVVKYAKRIKNLYKRMFDRISEIDRQITKLRVGITHTAESNEITEVLAKYGVSHGNVNITIITDTIKNLYDMLENYEIDFAIIEGRRQVSDMNYLMLDMDYLVCILSNNNPIAMNRSHKLWEEKGLDYKNIFKEEFISCEMHMLKPGQEIYLEAIRRTGRKPEEILFVDDSLSNVEAAKKAGMNADLYIPGHDLRALIEAWL